MTSTRSGASSGANADQDASAGAKHKLEESSPTQDSPAPKRTKQDDDKKQQTIEESFGNGDTKTPDKSTENADDAKDEEMKDPKDTADSEEPTSEKPTENKANAEEGENGVNGKDTSDTKEAATSQSDSAVEPDARKETPSNILEKGIIYFFFRGRVGIDEPSEVDDIARSYLVLRPIPKDAKLGDGPIGDAGNSRVLALPKKVLPLSGKDRFMVFVDMAKASFKELKENFLSASDYSTKTAGTRHTPAVTPVAEGIYAITTTGRESHLAYMITLPEKLGEVQEEVGIREKGSFVISTKNPQYPGPQNTQLPQGPDFPKDVQDEFRSLRWMPSQPKHFDFVNAQILLIGESSGIEKAVEPQKEDQKEGKEEPMEELEKLEEEDTQRMKDLSKDDSDAIFTDLGGHAKDYQKLPKEF